MYSSEYIPTEAACIPYFYTTVGYYYAACLDRLSAGSSSSSGHSYLLAIGRWRSGVVCVVAGHSFGQDLIGILYCQKIAKTGSGRGLRWLRRTQVWGEAHSYRDGRILCDTHISRLKADQSVAPVGQFYDVKFVLRRK